MHLDLYDLDGNQLALYQSEYKKLCTYLKEELPDIETPEKFKLLSPIRKLEILERAELKVIKYFSPSNLGYFELNASESKFDRAGDIVTCGGLLLKKDDHENCVVMQNNRIYICPKIRSKLGPICSEVIAGTESSTSPGLIGVSHSSLSLNGRIQFAGAFFHTAEHGWVLDNSSGHYTTHAYQFRVLLEKLEEQGVLLENLTIRMFISKTGETTPTDTDDNFDIFYENAADFLSRTRKSLIASTAAIFVPAADGLTMDGSVIDTALPGDSVVDVTTSASPPGLGTI